MKTSPNRHLFVSIDPKRMIGWVKQGFFFSVGRPFLWYVQKYAGMHLGYPRRIYTFFLELEVVTKLVESETMVSDNEACLMYKIEHWTHLTANNQSQYLLLHSSSVLLSLIFCWWFFFPSTSVIRNFLA